MLTFSVMNFMMKNVIMIEIIPDKKGEITHDEVTQSKLFHFIPEKPLGTKVNPRTAPMMLCVPEIGRPRNVAAKFHIAPPVKR